MSLNIYSSPEKITSNFKFIRDVEAEFEYITLDDNEAIRYLLKNIEKAEYCNSVSYIDGAGFKRPKNQLSIGCKIAILAQKMPNSVIDTIECRQIDRSNVIAYCTQGNILDVRKKRGYIDVGPGEINVVYDGTVFNKVNQLNNFIYKRNSQLKPTSVTIESNPSIVINLEPGLYLIGEASATNKNYLHNLFRKVGKNEAAVGSFSYEDVGIGSVDFMLNKGYKVILLNRADMYLDAPTLQLLRNYAVSGIVLIDYKGEELDVEDLKRVEVHTTKDKIEVAICYT